jgi:hypothetical protein
VEIVQRLYTEAVARQKETLPVSVPDRKGEHSAQVVYAIRPEFFVQMNDGFGVGLRVKGMPPPLEVSAKVAVVVDLAVVDDPHRAVLVVDRLAAAGDVDDAEPRHPQAGSSFQPRSRVVRAPVIDGLAHSLERFGGGGPFGVTIDYAGDSTHNIHWSSKKSGRGSL